MGTFVTQQTTPTVFEDKVAVLPTPQGLTAVNLPKADDFNTIKNALLDLRTEIRGQIYNVKHYGVVGDGTTDDTSAIQAVINFVSVSALGTGGASGALYFPPGSYRITSTLTYYGNPAYGISIHANHIGAGAGATAGAWLKWDGANDGTMLHLRGMCGSTIAHLGFDMNLKAGKAIHLERNSVTGSGSSKNRIVNCHFGQPRNADSIEIALGTDGGDTTYQVDQIEGYDNHFSSAFANEAGTAVKALQGGNCKDHRWRGGTCVGLKYGFDYLQASGTQRIESIAMADITTSCFVHGGAGVMVLEQIQVENSEAYPSAFLTGTVGSNPGSVKVDSCQVHTCPTDDYVISYTGKLTIENSQLMNDGTVDAFPANTLVLSGYRFTNSGNLYEVIAEGTTHASVGPTSTASTAITNGTATLIYLGAAGSYGRLSKIQCDPDSANGGCQSRSNFYKNSRSNSYAPIYNSSNGPACGVIGNNTSSQQSEMNVVSEGDHTGDFDGVRRQLLNWTGRSSTVSCATPSDMHAGLTVQYLGKLREGWEAWAVPRGVWTAASTSQALNVCTLLPKSSVLKAYLETPATYGGTAGTLKFKLGLSSGGAELLIEGGDVATAGGSARIQGTAASNADLGTALSGAIQGGTLGATQWANNTLIYLTLTSSSGNLGNGSATSLTNGSTVLYLKVERL